MLHWINQLLSNPLHGLLPIVAPLRHRWIGTDRRSSALRLSNCVAIEIDVLVGITTKAASPCTVPCIRVYTLQLGTVGRGTWKDMEINGTRQEYTEGLEIYYSCNEKYLYKPVFTEWISLSFIFLHGYGAQCWFWIPCFPLVEWSTVLILDSLLLFAGMEHSVDSRCLTSIGWMEHSVDSGFLASHWLNGTQCWF